MLPKRYSFIGLDIGARSIKAVQVWRRGKRASVESAAIIPYATQAPAIDAASVRRLRDVLERQGFHGNKVVISVPVDTLQVELLDLPPRNSGAPVDQLARAEMMRLAKLEPETFEMSTWDLPAPPRGGTGTALMAVAARHADTQSLYQTFEDEGLSIEAMDVQACAVARACRSHFAAQGLTAILDMGFAHAGLWFIRDEVTVFQRSFTSHGMMNVQDELCRQLDVEPDVAEHLISRDGTEAANSLTQSQSSSIQSQVEHFADALAQELDSSFAYIGHRYDDSTPATLFAIGGGAGSTAMRAALGARLKLSVEALAPMGVMECSAMALEKCSTPVLTTALGLALYEGD